VLEALVFVFGTLIGSFLNVCIYRIPRALSVVLPGSQCPSCGKRLKFWQLIPVVSFVALKGGCRACGAKISYIYPLVELLTGFVFLALFLEYGLTAKTALFAFLASVLISASFIDIEFRIIPNALVIAGLAVAVPALFFRINLSFSDALMGMAAGAGVLGLIALLSVLILKKAGMGGGDIKLMGMAGLYLGLDLTLASFAIAVYAAALVICVLLVLKKVKRGDHIPFGPFLSLGIILALLFGNEIIGFYFRMFW